MALWLQIIRYSLEFSLLAIQITMVYLVRRQQRKQVHRYLSGFFDVFLCKTVIEIIEFAIVSPKR